MKTLREIIGQTVGEASMLWSETPKGIFESTRGKELTDKVVREIEQKYEILVMTLADSTRGCMRDQNTTQFCHEALNANNENKKLKEALEVARGLLISCHGCWENTHKELSAREQIDEALAKINELMGEK